MNSEETPSTPNEKLPSDYRIAIGLLMKDRLILVPGFLVLLLPFLVGLVWNQQSLISLLIERLIQIAYLAFVSFRWIEIFTVRSFKPQLSLSKRLFRIFLFELAIWSTLSIPTLAQMSALPPETKMIFLFLLVPGVYLWFTYYFCFFPIMIGLQNWKDIFTEARNITANNFFLPLKTLIFPLAIISLLSGLLAAISPDGRHEIIVYLQILIAPLFWIFSVYLSVAIALRYTSDRVAHEAAIDPYREGRLATQSILCPTWLENLLRIRNASVLFLLSIIIWVSTLVRLESLAPAANIELKKVIVEGNTTKILIDAKDPQFSFRGFYPIHFAMAGEKRAVISKLIKSAKEVGQDEDLRLGIPEDRDYIQMELLFETERTGDALLQLEDVYLWYRGIKLLKIDMKKADIQNQVNTQETKNKEASPSSVPTVSQSSAS